MSDLLKQYLVVWVDRGAGAYIPPDPGCRGGDNYADIGESVYLMATSKQHAIRIIREAKGQSVQIKLCKLIK